MIRAGVNNPEHYTILVGLTEGNVIRLKAGRPIKAPLRSFGVDIPGNLAIMYGATGTDIENELREAGISLPTPTVDEKVVAEEAIRSPGENILILTSGLPRSGKSTWAKQSSFPVVNPDSIRLAIHGQRFRKESERLVWAHAHVMVDSLFRAGHKTVVLDACNGTRKGRDEWKSPDWKTVVKFIDTPADVCRQRAVAENDQEIIPVIDRMAGTWESPILDETRWP
jgi:predicted kinase